MKRNGIGGYSISIKRNLKLGISSTATGKEDRGDIRRGYRKGDLLVITYLIKYGILKYSLPSTPISVYKEELTALISIDYIVNSLGNNLLNIV